MLHKDRVVESASTGTTDNLPQTYHTADDKSIQQNMLATAVVKLRDRKGHQHLVRALLDGGSTCSFITES